MPGMAPFGMDLDFITSNAIIYVLIAWVVMLVVAKGLKLQNHGFEIKAYSIIYKNEGVQSVLTRMLTRSRRGIRVFADVSVVAGFVMMGFAFWFLFSNISAYFVKPTEFAEVTVLIPGVTLTSASAIINFLLCIPIVLIMHEGAHGIVATLERIKIKTGGFAIFIAMFAGFVEPDEEEFNKAKKISKLRVIGAGATSNVLFSLFLGIILLTNPLFAIIMPEPILGAFYESPDGVLVLSLIEGSGAEQAGVLPNDVITGIGDDPVNTAADLQLIGLEPGETVDVSIMRDGTALTIPVVVMESPDEPGRGLIGVLRDNSFAYQPIYDFIKWDNPQVSLFLLWLWMISFFIGIINMLPLPILDGGKFIHSIIDKKISEKSVGIVMWSIYGMTFVLFGLNIGLSYAKSGWFTI
ncbi:membrane-associated Zn-dependent protease [Cenarchaeum symbiosum A]|uniref:Membrane-associated Zn-dependent protease n=1 Tax=Cenarchaeum symbiosum (strain A) TaxID=414004 RepID=A0RTN7_CENSY|nr:membrane-associated Zn-dependent protease [Cenarchaeum symbiosum A]